MSNFISEHDLQNSIRLKLSEMGYCVFRANVGKFQTKDGHWFDTGLPKGFSDLFAIKGGTISFIEVKTETGKPTKEQLNFIKQMKETYGCNAGIARSVEDAVKIVEGNNGIT